VSTLRLSISKKGFDSSNGRGPSPILDDGRMLSLPIPEPRIGVSAATFGELQIDNESYASLLNRLGYDSFESTTPAHLDPDLLRAARKRTKGWRGMFGQVDSAATHLAKQGVGVGSLFLFWGWFDQMADRNLFRRRKGFSAIFGYLEVDHILEVGVDAPPDFALCHPHFAPEYPRVRNRVYVARKRLSWDHTRPGWGLFRYGNHLRLSGEGSRTQWVLPGCFHPDAGCCISHLLPKMWGERGSTTQVTIPDIGQEFVCQLKGEVAKWAKRIIDQSDVWSM
jgi:hypothetical protein